VKLHRWPKLLAEMGSFTRPRSLVPSTRKGRGQAPARDPKKRDRLKLVGQPGNKEHQYQHTCFSATCFNCGSVWLSAIKPIADNARRDGKPVYLCGKCRDL
jgi:hypothetical protein